MEEIIEPISKELLKAELTEEKRLRMTNKSHNQIYFIGNRFFLQLLVRGHVNMSDGEIAKKIDELFDLRPKAIEDRLKLRNPIYQETAAYGHLGREPQIVTKHFKSRYEGNKDVEVELFTWEKLDYVDKVKAAFGL